MKTRLFVMLAALTIGSISVQSQEAPPDPEPQKEMVAYLGVYTRKTKTKEQLTAQCATGTGIVVERVYEGTPAEKGGLLKGDLIEYFDTQLMINPDQLGVLIKAMKPGSTVQLTIKRDGKKMILPITLGEREKRSRRGRGGFRGWRGMRDMPEIRNIMERPEVRKMLDGLKNGDGKINLDKIIKGMNLKKGDFKLNNDGKGNIHFKTIKGGDNNIEIMQQTKTTGDGNARIITMPPMIMGGRGMHHGSNRGNNVDDEL